MRGLVSRSCAFCFLGSFEQVRVPPVGQSGARARGLLQIKRSALRCLALPLAVLRSSAHGAREHCRNPNLQRITLHHLTRRPEELELV